MDGVYDGKSEVLSVAIVWAERLSGRLQKHTKSSELPRRIQINDNTIEEPTQVPIDARMVSASTSDATPAETFLTDGRGIRKSSLIAHDDRIAMMTLLRHMREVGQVLQATPAASPSEAQLQEISRVRAELDDMRVKESIAEQRPRPERDRTRRDCSACGEEDGSLEKGWPCRNGHFICADGLKEANLRTQLSAENCGQFIQHYSKLICMQCKAPFSDREVAQHWDAQ